MAKLTQTDLPDCWIMDRATVKWQRKSYTAVGVMDLRSRKVLSWDLLRPVKPKPVAQVLINALTVYGKPPALVVGIDPVFRSPELGSIYADQITPVNLRQGKVSVTIFIRSLWRNLEWEGISCREPAADEGTFRQLVADWFIHYNRDRPHQALGYQVPDEQWRSQRYQV